MSDVEIRMLTPEGWRRGAGYSHCVTASGGTMVWVAGQVATREGGGEIVSDAFAAQWDQALGNVVAAVEAAGGSAASVTALKIHVTDLEEYHANGAGLVEPWKRHFGRHFPAITLVGVTGLVDARAKIEIDAAAVV